MDGELMMKKDDRGSPDRDRGRERERSRRGDRPSRFSSNTRERSPVRERRSGRQGDRRVFVSNVAYESKWQDIKDLFREQVGEVSYVELFMDETDKPRGCGIVEFESAEDASKAIEKMHRYELKGRKLVVKEDSDVERDKYGRPNRGGRGGSERDQHATSSGSSSRREDARTGTWDGSASANAATSSGGSSGNTSAAKWGNTYGLSPQFLESLWITGPLVSKVFVANLDYKVDEKKLREVFRLAGRVIHAELSVDKDGKSRGFGVVEFEHPVEAVQAISLFHNQTLYDRRLTVRMDRVDKPDGTPKLPEGLKSIGTGLGVNGTILNDVSRNLPYMASSPLTGLASNVQHLQAAAAAAQVQLAQGAQLGQPTLNAISQNPLAHLTGSNTLAPNLSVNSLLNPSLNVSDLANLNASQSFAGGTINANQLNSTIASGLAALNPALASGLSVGSATLGTNFSAINNQTSLIGGSGTSSFNNSGSVVQNTSSVFGQPRDFDAMSAALSANNRGGYSCERDNFRGESNSRETYNGSSRGVGNGRSNFGNSMQSATRDSDTVVVRNLPPNTTWQLLMEKFQNCGEIVAVEIQNKDTGVIKFSSPYEADRAVRDHDRTRFEGRTIDVLLYI